LLAGCAASLALGLVAPANAADRWRDIPMTVGWSSSAIELTMQAATTDGVAFACFTFTNRAKQTLERVVLHMLFVDSDGRVLDERHFDRRGTFAPNVPIVGYTGTGGGTRMTKTRQCALLNGRAMTFPSAALHGVRLSVSTLFYADGNFIIIR
jgi:hypothetical protein